MANNVVVGADYPHFLSSDLEDPVRATRIAELLQSKDLFSAAEFTRFQRDLSSAHARRFVKHLLQIQPTNSREAAVLDLLRAWDCQISADSVAASIYHVCQLNVLRTIFARHLGDHTDAYIGVDITGLADFSLYQGRTSVRLLDMLDNPRDTTWLRDPESGIPESQNEALHRALRITLQQMIAELGAGHGNLDVGPAAQGRVRARRRRSQAAEPAVQPRAVSHGRRQRHPAAGHDATGVSL